MDHIFILSDGTGGTAEQFLRAALTQFAEVDVAIERRPQIRTEEQIRLVIEEASRVRGMIVHTVVSNHLRRFIHESGRLHDIETMDLMGPALARLAERFASLPVEKPGLLRELNRDYFQRIEAMEFAFRHDDGQHVEELPKAEIVLVGVSRTFKTPLSMYLAFRGWLVANVPIVFGLPVPRVLYQLSPSRVFGLTTAPQRLAVLRKERDQHLGGGVGSYAEIDFVRQELAYAKQVVAGSAGWRVIDVTDRPIEEIASQIVADLRRSDAPAK